MMWLLLLLLVALLFGVVVADAVVDGDVIAAHS